MDTRTELEQARALLASQYKEEATALLARLADSRRSDPITLSAVADSYEEAGEVDLALEAWKAVLSIDADSARALIGAGRCLDAKGGAESQDYYTSAYSKISSAKSFSAKDCASLVEYMIARRNPRQALIAIQVFLKKNPSEDHGRFAADYIETVLKKTPNVYLLLESARAMVINNDLDEASRFYRKAVETSGNDPAFSWVRDEAIAVNKKAFLRGEDRRFLAELEFLQAQDEAHQRPVGADSCGAAPEPIKKYKVVIVAAAKNEALYLPEWVAYHRLLGVEHFYIYNNESSDETEEILAKLAQADCVTYFNWPSQPEQAAKTGLSNQVRAYWNAWRHLVDKAEWLAFIDLDEFIFLNKHRSLTELLEESAGFSGLAVNWKIFGTAEETHYQDDLVINRFDRYARNKHIKTIARSGSILHICNHPHACKFVDDNFRYADGAQASEDLQKWEYIHYDVIQINHYWTKSREEWIVKKNRGRPAFDKATGNRLFRDDKEYYDLINACRGTETSIMTLYCEATRGEIARLSEAAGLEEIMKASKAAFLSSVEAAQKPSGGAGDPGAAAGDPGAAAPAAKAPSLKPLMSPSEIALFQSVLRGKKAMIEYGMGGSTSVALALGVERVWSVDSSEEWIGKLSADPEVSAAAAAGRVKLLRADIGETGQFGYPVSKDGVEGWPKYPMIAWQHAGERAADVDVILVDGRFRVACVLTALFFVESHVPIILHDCSRPFYQPIFKFCSVTASCEELAVLSKKPGISHAHLMGELLGHVLDVR
jgi:tetratricopeptide (TPR) repeat protein